MKFDSMRSSLIGSLVVVLASTMLASCGGGGASSQGPQGGPPQIQPATGTFYAGVEYTFTVGGGRPPYFLSSSEPSLVAVPTKIDGNFFTIIPNNTGVIDTGLQPGSLPVRSVTITMRDSIGSTAAASIQVAQNFLTGYTVRFTSNCSAGTGGSTPSACAGGETALEFSATINGNLNGNREYRFEAVRGPWHWVFADGQVPGGTIVGNTMTTRTDHEGTARAIFRVDNNVSTQLGVFRVVDVGTGASTTHVFTITGIPLQGTLTLLPNQFTLTGINSAQCGTGSADFLAFDGTPPYKATSSFGTITLTPTESMEQPGKFTMTVSNPLVCLQSATIVVTDANLNRATVTVDTQPGTGDPPPAPVSVTPGQVTLGCGATGSVSILGGPTGTATFSVSSADARVTTTVSGRTVTVTRTATDPVGTPVSPTPGTPNPIFYTVTVTDGTTSTNIGVAAPSNCPP